MKGFAFTVLGKGMPFVLAGEEKCHLLHRRVSVCTQIAPLSAKSDVAQIRKIRFGRGLRVKLN